MRLLFITRNFPPQRGGLERLSYQLYLSLKKRVKIILIKWGGKRNKLPFVLPYFFVKAVYFLLFKKVDIIYLNEGFLSILGIILKIFRVPIVITINGLDITYKNKLYQFIIPRCIAKMNKIVCISKATKEECVRRGISQDKIEIIHPGIEDIFYIGENRDNIKIALETKLGVGLFEKKIILSVGRLIERKGFHWFIKNVIPLLIDDCKEFLYIVVGEGKMQKDIQRLIYRKNLQSWVLLVGNVDDDLLKLLYNSADVFVMPNIVVKEDIEGFGIVALEAASCGIPVVASCIEGIKDALLDGRLGKLIPCYDHISFARVILNILKQKPPLTENIRKLVIDNFSWDKISEKYFKVFYSLSKK